MPLCDRQLRKENLDLTGRARGVYQALLKYDRAWVTNRPSLQGKQGSPQKRSARAQDFSLAKRIKAAAQQLRKRGQRVTVVGLSRQLDQKLNVRGLRLMPKTAATLATVLDVHSRALERERRQVLATGTLIQ